MDKSAVTSEKTQQTEETKAVDFCCEKNWGLNCSEISLLFSFTCWKQQAAMNAQSQTQAQNSNKTLTKAIMT